MALFAFNFNEMLVLIRTIGIYRRYLQWWVRVCSGCNYKTDLKALHIILAKLKPFSKQAFVLQVRVLCTF